ncbi:MAG TPA: alpha/beta hydrolase [Thermoanaerobaculia bacterium]|nr:alpha/beta hydrolase [Thermoanaerobaculia bacterium]
MHGFPTASWDWHSLWPELTARWRIIAPDMIGYGFSAKPRHYGYSLNDQADLYENLVKTLSVRRVHLLAHDVGDSVAQELLARQTLDIASVCLLNGGILPEAHRATRIQKLLAGPLGPLIGRFLSERRFRTSFARVFAVKPSEAELADFWRLIAFNDGRRIAHKLIGYIAERRKYRDRWVGALRTTIPLRVINGPEDPISGAHMMARLREEVPGVDIVSLPGIGHYPQVEDPAAVLQAYLEFRA